ncbi:MAG: EAL domain-containing protein [Desulfovermiculus sp.]|nr:EAL domain-containing protein [Desulfovermiculus sp.]
MALSGAKKSANRIQQFAGDEEGISREFHLEQDLKSALTNEEFWICYQPQINLQSGKIVGLEALIRWSHPQRGLVSPGEFIPLLERSGMIVPVDAWVVRNVCEQLRSWRDEGFLVRASVNLSVRDLINDSIIGVVSSALEENRLPAEALGVEITETDLMENVDRASGILRTLSDWGIRVALDDFRKGYSCLSYLQRLDIHVIKIDKEFVAGMLENADSLTLVQTIIAMAHNMGKEVLAEGVER